MLQTFVSTACVLLPTLGLTRKWMFESTWSRLRGPLPLVHEVLTEELDERLDDGENVDGVRPDRRQPSPVISSDEVRVRCPRCDQPTTLVGSCVAVAGGPCAEDRSSEYLNPLLVEHLNRVLDNAVEESEDDLDNDPLAFSDFRLSVQKLSCAACGLVLDARFELDHVGIRREYWLRYMTDNEFGFYNDPSNYL